MRESSDHDPWHIETHDDFVYLGFAKLTKVLQGIFSIEGSGELAVQSYSNESGNSIAYFLNSRNRISICPQVPVAEK